MIDGLAIRELRMQNLRQKKRKRIKNFLLGFPLTLILIVINIIVVGWVIHIMHAIFTDALEHMSLYEWTEHLYILAKNTFEDLFDSIALVI